MQRIRLAELQRRCQKPDHRRLGNWFARRVSRPVALRITYVVAPWGVSANVATLSAWACGVAAAVVFGWGTIWAWVLAAGLMQLWYLLDHVDGQLARLHGTASLDGVQLDYLMHHTVNLLVPLGVGFGLFVQSCEPFWLMAGTAWGVSLLLIALQHDARYKAFIKRLKRLRGELRVRGGGGGRPEAQPPVPRLPWSLAAWTMRKACETHVIMNLLALLVVSQLLLGDTQLLAGRVYVGLMAPLALLVAVCTIARSQRNQSAEREFAAWYRVGPGDELTFANGWWTARPSEDGETGEFAGDQPATPGQSS